MTLPAVDHLGVIGGGAARTGASPVGRPRHRPSRRIATAYSPMQSSHGFAARLRPAVRVFRPCHAWYSRSSMHGSGERRATTRHRTPGQRALSGFGRVPRLDVPKLVAGSDFGDDRPVSRSRFLLVVVVLHEPMYLSRSEARPS